MAINQNTNESSFQSSGNGGGSDSASVLRLLLEHLLVQSVNNGDANFFNEADYQKICGYIVPLLVADQIDVTTSKQHIRNLRSLADTITKQFQQLVERKPFRDLVKDCLEKMYTADALSVKKLPSPFATIMLALMDPKQGVAWILSKNMSDEHIRKILTVFIDWLCTINFAPNLNVWVIQMVEGLLAKGRTNCILNVRKDKLKQCKELMPLPHYQQQVGPVINCLESCGDLQQENGRLSYACSERYENGLDVDNSLIRSNARVGLVNLGNTCYMNSVVQALAMTKQFCTEVLLKQIDAPPFSEIQQLLALLIHSRRPELTPRAVLASTRPPGFAPGYQQDSSEFLSYLLDRLHEQEKKHLHGNAPQQQQPPQQQQHNTLSLMGPNSGKTLVQKTFEGQLSVGCLCTICDNTNHTMETFRSLDLSFPDESDLAAAGDGTHSVQSLLDYFCSSEKLVGENQYFCDRCRQLRDCERSVTVTVPPQNLILTVKHFRYDQSRNLRAKLMNKILHNENISLTVTDESGHCRQLHYRNYAVVVHYGTSMDSGHYYTYAQDGTGKWFKFNDNYVTECSTSELQNIPSPNTPYILFYQLVMNSATDGAQAAASSAQGQTIGATYGEDIDGVGGGTVHTSFPELNELPTRLQELVRNDNLLYRREVEEQRDKKSSQILPVGGVGGNRRQSDDYDDPPPSSCGNKWLPDRTEAEEDDDDDNDDGEEEDDEEEDNKQQHDFAGFSETELGGHGHVKDSAADDRLTVPIKLEDDADSDDGQGEFRKHADTKRVKAYQSDGEGDDATAKEIRHWSCDDVCRYFGRHCKAWADLFHEQEIDGPSLLLMRRGDVLSRFGLKLGPAMELYQRIVALQNGDRDVVDVRLTWIYQYHTHPKSKQSKWPSGEWQARETLGTLRITAQEGDRIMEE
uniref:USP domain-containing protein n=1 Tax=Anopheles dirus TaxID=7168 RepID=A0A182NNR2_9DIPT